MDFKGVGTHLSIIFQNNLISKSNPNQHVYCVKIQNLGKIYTKLLQNEHFMCKKLILVTFPMSQL